MSGLDPFTPDAEYCVYCHQPAVGMCAECSALCCPDCVELVMGWTTRRAVCSSCLRHRGTEPASDSHRGRAIVALLLTIAFVVAILWR